MLQHNGFYIKLRYKEQRNEYFTQFLKSEMMAKEKFHKMKKTLFICVLFSDDILLVLWKLSCRDQPVSYIRQEKRGCWDFLFRQNFKSTGV